MNENKRLFELLKNGPAEELKPMQIIECFETINGTQKEENEQQRKIMEFKHKLESVQMSHSTTLKEIRAFWKEEKK